MGLTIEDRAGSGNSSATADSHILGIRKQEVEAVRELKGKAASSLVSRISFGFHIQCFGFDKYGLRLYHTAFYEGN